MEIENKIPAAYNSTDTKHYSLTDKNPLRNSYYRLKMVDRTGEFTYSKTISLVEKTNFTDNFELYPNPTTNDIRISYTAETTSTINFTVLDILGKIISQTTVIPTIGENMTSLSLTDYPTGIYLVRIQNENSEQVVRKIVKN